MIESFKNGDAVPVYRFFETTDGWLQPVLLRVELGQRKLDCCDQLVETEDRDRLLKVPGREIRRLIIQDENLRAGYIRLGMIRKY